MPTSSREDFVNGLLGQVVFRDGQLTYNDQPLGATVDAALVAACRERGF